MTWGWSTACVTAWERGALGESGPQRKRQRSVPQVSPVCLVHPLPSLLLRRLPRTLRPDAFEGREFRLARRLTVRALSLPCPGLLPVVLFEQRSELGAREGLRRHRLRRQRLQHSDRCQVVRKAAQRTAPGQQRNVARVFRGGALQRRRCCGGPPDWPIRCGRASAHGCRRRGRPGGRRRARTR